MTANSTAEDFRPSLAAQIPEQAGRPRRKATEGLRELQRQVLQYAFERGPHMASLTTFSMRSSAHTPAPTGHAVLS